MLHPTKVTLFQKQNWQRITWLIPTKSQVQWL